MRMLVRLVLLLILCGAGARAHADTRTVEAAGEAAGAGDARVRAIDTALADAVSRVLVELVPEDARQRHRKPLADDIVRRARLYVTSFRVLEESQAEGRVRLRLVAELDLDKLRAKLTELGVSSAPAVPAAAGRSRPRVVVLLHAALGDDVATTFGERGGDGGVAGRALTQELRDYGFDVVAAAGSAPPVSRETEPGVPLAGAAAAELARRAGAGGAFVIGVEAGLDGPIRGTRLVGARGRAVLRVIDARGEVAELARAEVSGAGFGAAAEEAMSRAVRELSSRMLRAVSSTLVEVWPPVITSDEAILVEVVGVRGWQAVRALIEHLAATQGVVRVWPRHLGTRGVILAVATDMDRQRVASALKRAELPWGRVSVSAWGDSGLRVSVDGDGARP